MLPAIFFRSVRGLLAVVVAASVCAACFSSSTVALRIWRIPRDAGLATSDVSTRFLGSALESDFPALNIGVLGHGSGPDRSRRDAEIAKVPERDYGDRRTSVEARRWRDAGVANFKRAGCPDAVVDHRRKGHCTERDARATGCSTSVMLERRPVAGVNSKSVRLGVSHL